MVTHPFVDSLPESSLAHVPHRRRQSVRPNELVNIERPPLRDLVLVLDRILNDECLTNVGHFVHGLVVQCLLCLDDGWQIHQFCRVRRLADVEYCSP